jgi:Mn2+/Fe2+ NRAMP family transporter
MQGERRKNNRYATREKAFAAIGSGFVRMMPIIDVGNQRSER